MGISPGCASEKAFAERYSYLTVGAKFKLGFRHNAWYDGCDEKHIPFAINWKKGTRAERTNNGKQDML